MKRWRSCFDTKIFIKEVVKSRTKHQQIQQTQQTLCSSQFIIPCVLLSSNPVKKAKTIERRKPCEPSPNEQISPCNQQRQASLGSISLMPESRSVAAGVPGRRLSDGCRGFVQTRSKSAIQCHKSPVLSFVTGFPAGASVLNFPALSPTVVANWNSSTGHTSPASPVTVGRPGGQVALAGNLKSFRWTVNLIPI